MGRVKGKSAQLESDSRQFSVEKLFHGPHRRPVGPSAQCAEEIAQNGADDEEGPGPIVHKDDSSEGENGQYERKRTIFENTNADGDGADEFDEKAVKER